MAGLRDHHFGPVGMTTGRVGWVAIDAVDVIHRLLLFDRCTVESARLRELPGLIRLFGVEGLCELVRDGALDLLVDAAVVGEVGRSVGLHVTEKRGGVLPNGSFHLAAITMASRQRYMDGVMAEVRPNLTVRELRLVEQDILPRVCAAPAEVTRLAVDTTNVEVLGHSTILKDAISVSAARHRGTARSRRSWEVESTSFVGDIRIVPSDGGGISDAEHIVLGDALFAIATLNLRMEMMRTLKGVTGLRDDEAALLEARARLLWQGSDPDLAGAQLVRAASIAGLPGVHVDARVDVAALMKLRASSDILVVREWVRGLSDLSDADIRDAFAGLRPRMAAVAAGPRGRAFRYITSTVAGFLPLGGSLVGIAASALDAFGLEWLLGRPGPAVLLGRHYRSLFPDKEAT